LFSGKPQPTRPADFIANPSVVLAPARIPVLGQVLPAEQHFARCSDSIYP
jgi:hypothetical protein